jgi:hypothetical protein
MAIGVCSSSLVAGPSSAADGWVLCGSDPLAALGLDVSSVLAAIRCDRRTAKIALTGNSVRRKSTVAVVSISENPLMVSPFRLLMRSMMAVMTTGPITNMGDNVSRQTIPRIHYTMTWEETPDRGLLKCLPLHDKNLTDT